MQFAKRKCLQATVSHLLLLKLNKEQNKVNVYIRMYACMYVCMFVCMSECMLNYKKCRNITYITSQLLKIKRFKMCSQQNHETMTVGIFLDIFKKEKTPQNKRNTNQHRQVQRGECVRTY